MNSTSKQRFEFARSLHCGRAVLGLVLAILAVACRTTDAPLNFDRIVIKGTGPDREQLEKEVPEQQLRLLDIVQQLVLDRQDRAARNVLQRLSNLDLKDSAKGMVEAFTRILDGRELANSIRLELVTQAHSEDPSRYRVVLFVLNESPMTVVLRPGAATLTLEETVVDGDGRERRSETSKTTDTLSKIELAPGEPVELPLLEFVRPVSGATIASIVAPAQDAPAARSSTSESLSPSVLATRYVWHLALLAGGFESDGERLPAMGLKVIPAERLWISRDLPQAPVEPQEFLEFVRAAYPSQLELTDLMGLAVRIPGERRMETLELLQVELADLSLDGLAALAPALRWISGDSRLGDDPSAWRDWLERRAALARSESTGNRSLDLPNPNSAASSSERAE